MPDSESPAPHIALGERIQNARAAAGFKTATAFAKALSARGRPCSANNVYRWERGEVEPHEWMLAIADECGVSLDWLVRGPAKPAAPPGDPATADTDRPSTDNAA